MSRTGNAGRETDRPAILMVSPEPLLLMEAEKDLRARLIPPGEQTLNYMMLYGWEARLGDILEFLQTLPFLGDRRLLVVREVQDFKEWKQLVDYLKDPNPKSLFLMTSSELKKSSAQFKLLSSYAGVSELRRPYGKALVKWVGDRIGKSGKSIDSQLSEVLIQIAGEDLGILATEIDKVILSSGDGNKIMQEDLSVSVPGGVEVIFNLLDALGDQNGSKAMSSLRSLLMSDSPPEYLVHMMAWHYRQLLRGKELVKSGLSPTQAAVKMGKKYSGLKEKFARQVGRATENDLVRALKVLAEYDRALKQGRIPSGTLLDRLVLELLA